MKNFCIGLIGIIAGSSLFIAVAYFFGVFTPYWHDWFLILPAILGGIIGLLESTSYFK